jgi:predicted PurR-regulated permease PerM
LLWPFLPALVTAAVLGLILLPVHRALLRLIGHAGVAAGITTVGGTAGVLIPLFLLGTLVARELAEAADWFARNGPALVESLPDVATRVEGWIESIGIRGAQLGQLAAARVQETPTWLLGRAFGLLAGVGGLALQGGVALFTLFFALRDSGGMEGKLRTLVPLDSERTGALLLRARQVVRATVYGSLTVSLTQGILGGLAFLALGMPTPALWGAVMAAASLVPLLGPGVVWLPAAVILIIGGSVVRGILLLAFGGLVISTVDNVIRSVLVGSRAGIHPLVVLLGVLGGILLFGGIGVVVGPVVLVLSLLLLEMVRETLFPQESGVATDPNAAGPIMAVPSATDPAISEG